MCATSREDRGLSSVNPSFKTRTYVHKWEKGGKCFHRVGIYHNKKEWHGQNFVQFWGLQTPPGWGWVETRKMKKNRENSPMWCHYKSSSPSVPLPKKTVFPISITTRALTMGKLNSAHLMFFIIPCFRSVDTSMSIWSLESPWNHP